MSIPIDLAAQALRQRLRDERAQAAAARVQEPSNDGGPAQGAAAPPQVPVGPREAAAEPVPPPAAALVETVEGRQENVAATDLREPAGATPEDWSLLCRLGLTEDLLPVVSAREVKIHPQSKLKDLGKTPSRVTGDDLAVGIPGWTEMRSTDRQVATWAKDGRLGICIQTRRVRAIDIDIPDPHHAAKVRELVKVLIGTLPVRWREGSGKCLLAFSMPGDCAKRVLRTEHGAVELLATGQQFVAFGTHPSGSRYQWSGLDACEIAGIPEITPDEFEVLWQGLAAMPGVLDASSNRRTGVAPSVPRSALDMHRDPVVAFLDANGWVREFDRDGRVHVRCPWEAEHTTDSGPTATTYFPAGVGGFAQGHWRCLHAHCQGRGDAEWHDAIGYEASMFHDLTKTAMLDDGTVVERPGRDWGPLPVLSTVKSHGRPWFAPTADNLMKAVGHPAVCGHQLAYDAFRDEIMVADSDGETWSPLRDTTYMHLQVNLERHGFLSPRTELLRRAVHAVAEQKQIDSAIQWVESLRWDGVPRVERFLVTYLGVEDTPYARAVGRYMWTALAGRALEPGCKADMVPVLIGDQGIKKTSLVEALSPLPEAFVEVDLSARDADLARSLRGKLVGEIAELRGLSSRNSESIKAWISRRHEEWVPKYRETTTRLGRRLLLIGTGNNTEFLGDETGERRWLPVRMAGVVGVPAIERDRDQLWAEGAAMFRSGGVDWQEAQRLAAGVHVDFKVHDSWQDAVAQWLSLDEMDSAEGAPRAERGWSLADVAAGALGLQIKDLGDRQQKRLGKVLRSLGFEKRDERVGGSVVKRWALKPAV
jgi:hypothetical protein